MHEVMDKGAIYHVTSQGVKYKITCHEVRTCNNKS